MSRSGDASISRAACHLILKRAGSSAQVPGLLGHPRALDATVQDTAFSGALRNGTALEAEHRMAEFIIERWRTRLSDLSWFMHWKLLLRF